VTQIRDQTYAPPPLFSDLFGQYGQWGFSQEFTFTLGASVTYPVMWGANGTWPAGTYPLDQYGVGDRGAIPLATPEPATISLAALGVVLATPFIGCKRVRRI
jgi:hypothetical protein